MSDCTLLDKCPLANKLLECHNGRYLSCAIYAVVSRWPPSAQVKKSKEPVDQSKVG